MGLGILARVMGKPKGCVMLGGTVAIGATGAVGTQTIDGCTVTRAAAGRYTFTFAHKYQDMLGASIIIDNQGTAVGLREEIYTGYSSSAGTVSFSILDDTTETDPTSGNIMTCMFMMKSSVV